MKIVYMGTPDFSVYSLEKIFECKSFSIELVLTQPDRPGGRGQKLQASPVKRKAEELSLTILQSDNINTDDFIDRLREIAPDVLVVVAFGQKLSPEILEIPKYGCINLHGSLLPEYRGASPIHQAILDGRGVTGVTTMYMAEGWDTGDIIYKEEVRIEPTDTVGVLHDKLAEVGADLLIKTLQDIKNSTAPRKEQDHSKATYTAKIDKTTGKINWNAGAHRIYNQVRGTNPWPGAFTYYQDEVLKIWKTRIRDDYQLSSPLKSGTILNADSKNGLLVQTGDGIIEIEELQISGRKRMLAKDFLHGYTIKTGEVLGIIKEV